MMVKFVRDTRKVDGWVTGKIGSASFTAKVFDLPSDYGIDEGRVSKLFVKNNGRVIASYDRDWDVEPEASDMDLYNQLMDALNGMKPCGGFEINAL